MHMAHTAEYGGGIYGFKGFTAADMRVLHIHPERILLANLVGGFWFCRSDLVRAIFRAEPLSFATGEDFHFAYAARKWHNAATWVYPHDPRDRDTHAIVSFDRYRQISNSGDTTLSRPGNMELRNRIARHVWQHGMPLSATASRAPEAILLVAVTPAAAAHLRPAVEALRREGAALGIATGGHAFGGGDGEVRDAFGGVADAEAFDLHLAADVPRWRDADLQADGLYGSRMILEAIRAQALVVSLDDYHPALFGPLLAARALGVPAIAVAWGNATAGPLSPALLAMADVECYEAACAARAALAFSRRTCPK